MQILSSAHLGIFLMAVITFILSGCADQPEHTLTVIDKHYELKYSRQQQVISFPEGTPRLTSQDEAYLVELVKMTSAGKSSVHITIPAKTSGLGKKRLRYLVSAFQKWGVPAKRIHASSDLVANQDGIAVIFERYEALASSCPQGGFQMKKPGSGPAFSCARTQTFLLMLEDPIVLFGNHQNNGSRAGSETVRETAIIADYRNRKDKEKALKVEKIESTGG